MTRHGWTAAAAAALVALLAASCGDPAPPVAPAQGTRAPSATPPSQPTPPKPVMPERHVDGSPPHEVLTKGEGAVLKDGDVVLVHYTLTDPKTGKDIASSRRLDEPFILDVGAGHVIEGWERLMRELRVGDHVKATVPSDLAYGDDGVAGVVPPRTDLVLDVEVLALVPPVTWEVVTQGDGTPIVPGMTVKVIYTGTLPNGDVFDSSRDRNEIYEFHACIGEVIEGWDRVLPKMRVGDRWTVHVPWPFAYGAEGRGTVIPPRTDLTYDIEVISAEPPK